MFTRYRMHLKLISLLFSFVVDWIKYFMVPLKSMEGQSDEPKTVEDNSDNLSDHSDGPTDVKAKMRSFVSKNTKSTNTGDTEDKDNDNNNNCYDKTSKHKNPIITNYYYYDQRIYNNYKMEEVVKQSHGFSVLEVIKLLKWKYLLIALVVLVFGTGLLCYLGVDILTWFIYHRVFGYLIDNHMVVVRTNVPV